MAMSYEEVLELFGNIAADRKYRANELREYLDGDPDEDETPDGILSELEVLLESELREVKRLRAERD